VAHSIERAERISMCAMMFLRAASAWRKGDWQVDVEEDAWTRVLRLMRDLESLLLVIKEAAIPVLTTGDPDQAWRTRRFLRLADRMIEDMHSLQFATEEQNGV
jgi:hypothetical protein